METSKRARRRKSDTAKADLKPPLAVSGGQGVHREMESEGHEEKFRAVINTDPNPGPRLQTSAFRGNKGLEVANKNRASGEGRRMFLTSPLQKLFHAGISATRRPSRAAL